MLQIVRTCLMIIALTLTACAVSKDLAEAPGRNLEKAELTAKERAAQEEFSQREISKGVSKAHREAASAYLLTILKDPYTSKITYDFETYDPKSRITSVCGTVRAKNAAAIDRFYVTISNARAASGEINGNEKLVQACGALSR